MVATPPVTVTRTSETIMYPRIIPSRLGAASMNRWAKPLSKSRAIAKPVNAPPMATVWKQYPDVLEGRVARLVVEVRDIRDAGEAAGERGQEEQREQHQRV